MALSTLIILSMYVYVLPYNLNKYTQYKRVWKLFKVVYLHQHTVILLYRLVRNEKLLEMFAYPSNTRTFY